MLPERPYFVAFVDEYEAAYKIVTYDGRTFVVEGCPDERFLFLKPYHDWFYHTWEEFEPSLVDFCRKMGFIPFSHHQN